MEFAQRHQELSVSRSGGVYIHIPYCRVRCPYCNFAVVRDRGGHQAYLSALIRSIGSTQSTIREIGPETLYFGGGTPSRLRRSDLAALTSVLDVSSLNEQGKEVTLEANPEDLDPEKLEQYRQLGINRLSIGVQRLDAHGLRRLGRAASQRAIELLPGWLDHWKALGGRATVDFIYGLEGDTPDRIRPQLQKILGWPIEHLSAYALTIEPETPFALGQARGLRFVGDADEVERCYAELIREIEGKGWEAYEVSNFAAPGARARHNSQYWLGRPYLGFGQSAVSMLKGRDGRTIRRVRHSAYDDYIHDPVGFETHEVLFDTQVNIEKIMLGLRSFVGVERDLWQRWSAIQPKVTEELLEQNILEFQADRIVMPAVKRLLADEVAARWISAIEPC